MVRTHSNWPLTKCNSHSHIYICNDIRSLLRISCSHSLIQSLLRPDTINIGFSLNSSASILHHHHRFCIYYTINSNAVVEEAQFLVVFFSIFFPVHCISTVCFGLVINNILSGRCARTRDLAVHTASQIQSFMRDGKCTAQTITAAAATATTAARSEPVACK